jgi:3-methyladenine DNA glycosylase/8-oxoguanine DNA glycosylase
VTAGVLGTSFEIEPLGPYSLEESASFIGAWHKAPADSGSEEGHLHLAFLTDLGWKAVGVCLRQGPEHEVRGDVYGDAPVSEVRAQVARILSLDIDGRGWPDAGRRDPVVGRLQKKFPGFRPVNWSNAYEAAAWTIISTRVTMRQGQGVKDRMSRELGHEVDIHGHRLWVFPEPARLDEIKTFRGLFGRKAEYLRELAAAAIAGRLDTDRLRALSAETALSELKRLPGIGDFGSQLIRLRALSVVDELPTSEKRLLGALREAYGLAREPDIRTLEDLAEAWRPYRTWVCVCLRRSGGEGAGMMHSRATG